MSDDFVNHKLNDENVSACSEVSTALGYANKEGAYTVAACKNAKKGARCEETCDADNELSYAKRACKIGCYLVDQPSQLPLIVGLSVSGVVLVAAMVGVMLYLKRRR